MISIKLNRLWLIMLASKITEVRSSDRFSPISAWALFKDASAVAARSVIISTDLLTPSNSFERLAIQTCRSLQDVHSSVPPFIWAISCTSSAIT